jgi:hypothetical protein
MSSVAHNALRLQASATIDFDLSFDHGMRSSHRHCHFDRKGASLHANPTSPMSIRSECAEAHNVEKPRSTPQRRDFSTQHPAGTPVEMTLASWNAV